MIDDPHFDEEAARAVVQLVAALVALAGAAGGLL